MGSIYQMEKNGFEGLAGYTVGQIEKLLTPINFVKVNGNPAKQDYKLREDDKATIAVEMPPKKKVLTEK
ncbi:MAG: hypothetical protein KKB25_00510 [Nanoarchaeota archaeon]|nr:hypothetical protein [Nanoarchaeota archaeon]